MNEIHHALVLNLHQPSGNLDALLDQNESEAHEILQAIDRIPRALWAYEDVGRVHLAISGTLLENLNSADFQRRVYGTVDCGSLLWYLQNRKIIDVLGTGYYHPVFPLIPEADRVEHLERWLGIARHLLWRKHFEGFWPPEMGFEMAMIPLLKRMGYEYVIVDSENVEPLTPMAWGEVRYRPHTATYDGVSITVIVRDRELSDAQESGMSYEWFQKEVYERTKWCDFPPLVTTCTDGDNGGWFRNRQDKGNFWGAFYRELMEQARAETSRIKPCFIRNYLHDHGVHGEVYVKKAAWNTGWHHGRGFVQWTGSLAQKAALERVKDLSKAVHDARWRAGEINDQQADLSYELENALWHLLRAETSCNFYWGEAWVDRCHADLDASERALEKARKIAPC